MDNIFTYLELKSMQLEITYNNGKTECYGGIYYYYFNDGELNVVMRDKGSFVLSANLILFIRILIP